LCKRLFSVKSSSIYAQARSVLLSFKPALLGLHKLPHPWFNGGFALRPADPKFLSAVDVGVESLLHWTSIAQQSRLAFVDQITTPPHVFILKTLTQDLPCHFQPHYRRKDFELPQQYRRNTPIRGISCGTCGSGQIANCCGTAEIIVAVCPFLA